MKKKKTFCINIVHTIKGHFSQQGPIFKKYFPQRLQQRYPSRFYITKKFPPLCLIASTSLVNSKCHFGEWVK